MYMKNQYCIPWDRGKQRKLTTCAHNLVQTCYPVRIQVLSCDGVCSLKKKGWPIYSDKKDMICYKIKKHIVE